MSKPLVLDSGPLGQIAHPKPNPLIEARYRQLILSGRVIVVPEITDFEVRPSFLLNNMTASLLRLDALKRDLTYLPLDTSVMLKAAELWAQALQVGGIIVTDNAGHLVQFVEAKTWKELT